MKPAPPLRTQDASQASSPKRGHVKLTPLDKLSAQPSSNVREQLAAARYFDQHGIREHFITLSQTLMIHQPSDPLEFMHDELVRLLENRERARALDYKDAITQGACVYTLEQCRKLSAAFLPIELRCQPLRARI